MRCPFCLASADPGEEDQVLKTWNRRPSWLKRHFAFSLEWIGNNAQECANICKAIYRKVLSLVWPVVEEARGFVLWSNLGFVSGLLGPVPFWAQDFQRWIWWVWSACLHSLQWSQSSLQSHYRAPITHFGHGAVTSSGISLFKQNWGKNCTGSTISLSGTACQNKTVRYYTKRKIKDIWVI